MTSISRTLSSFCSLVLIGAVLAPFIVHAQGTMSLSVSPTLFEMTANPSQEWSSSVRVINPNPYDLTLYAEVMNFAPQGEAGQGRFIPVIESETQGSTIAEWLRFERTEFVVPAEQTIELPFRIDVPENAQPGGHFAAILIGTKPPETNNNRSRVETSQVVTTLLFLRVSGEVVEEGSIRSFRPLESILERPEATFELRFENTGNVHILPQGEIRISNMWGQERGVVPINRDTMFGNVLPDSVRKFSFTWTGDWSIADIGRYTAVATLAYGQEDRNFASSETTFWIIPWKEAFLIIGMTIAFGLFMTWSIKLYIRRMLALAVSTADPKLVDRRALHVVSAARPIERGMLDLRQRYAASDTFGQKVRSTFSFAFQYKLFFFSAFIVIGFTSGVVWFIDSAASENRAYQVEVLGSGGTNLTLNSEDIAYQEIREPDLVTSEAEESASSTPIMIVNRSGESGMAAAVRLVLEEGGLTVVGLDTDFGVTERNTVVVYHPDYLDDALAVSRLIEGALLSSFSGESETPITVYVGKDFQSAVQ